MKLSSVFLLLILFSTITIGQEPISPEMKKLWDDFKFSKFVNGEHLNIEPNYKGSPYKEFDEKKCTPILLNEQKIEGLTIRYNIYQDQMELKREGVYYVIPRQREFAAFQLAEHYFKYLIFSENNQINRGNLEVLAEGKCTLYKRFNIFLASPQAPKPYQDAKPAEFKRKAANYFVGVHEKIPIKIKNNKDFIELLPEHQDKISHFIKKNKIKIREEDDFIKLVEYYNSL